jgi:hypothetical protein
MYRVIVGVLRSHHGECANPISLPQTVSEYAERLQAGLSSEKEAEELVPLLHALLLALFVVELPPLVPEIQFTVIQYMVFGMLDHNGGFKTLGDVRQLSAMLRYWCRLAVFAEIVHQDREISR